MLFMKKKVDLIDILEKRRIIERVCDPSAFGVIKLVIFILAGGSIVIYIP